MAARQLYRIGFDKIVGWITTAEAQENGLFTARLERMNLPEFNSAKAVVEGEIIDVRTTAEFQSGHLEGARSFPYTRLKAHLDELPKDRRLFVHCGSGKRASLAASFLLTQGFDAVHLDGVCDECERIAKAQGVAH